MLQFFFIGYVAVGLGLSIWSFKRGPLSYDYADVIAGETVRIVGTIFLTLLISLLWPLFAILLTKEAIKQRRAARMEVNRLRREIERRPEVLLSPCTSKQDDSGGRRLLIYPTDEPNDGISWVAQWHGSEKFSLAEFIKIAIGRSKRKVNMPGISYKSTWVYFAGGNDEVGWPVENCFSLFLCEAEAVSLTEEMNSAMEGEAQGEEESSILSHYLREILARRDSTGTAFRIPNNVLFELLSACGKRGCCSVYLPKSHEVIDNAKIELCEVEIDRTIYKRLVLKHNNQEIRLADTEWMHWS